MAHGVGDEFVRRQDRPVCQVIGDAPVRERLADVVPSRRYVLAAGGDADVTARVIEVRLLLDAYGVDDPGVRAKLEELAKHSKKRGWWLEHAEHLRPDYLDHIALEDDATYIRQWQPVLVPGLLQTPAYARAVITGGPDYIAPEVVAQLVNVREGRQTKIQEGGTPYTAILGEMVVAQPLVSGDIHREQLAAILEVAQRKNVTVQVLGSESKLKEEKPAVVAAKVPALNGTSGSSERQGHRKGARRMIRRAPLRRRAAMSYSFSIT